MASSVAHTGRKEVATHSVEWIVSDFMEEINTSKTGEMIKLENVKVGETNWYVQLYPSGQSKGDKDAVSLYCYSKNNVPTTAKMAFFINGQDSWENKTKSFTENFTENGFPWGYAKFITHKGITDEKLLVNGELKVEIKITVYGEKETTIELKDSQNFDAIEIVEKMKLGKDLKECWMSDDFSDVQIKCGEVVFYCHRMILARRSTHFRTLLEGGFKESHTRVIEIKDMDVKTLRTVLKYIYSGELDNMESNAMFLMEAAQRFDLADLKDICEKYLATNYMKLENVIDTLVMADLHEGKNLKKAAMELIIANSNAIIKQEGWKQKLQRSKNLLCEIFEAIAAKN